MGAGGSPAHPLGLALTRRRQGRRPLGDSRTSRAWGQAGLGPSSPLVPAITPCPERRKWVRTSGREEGEFWKLNLVTRWRRLGNPGSVDPFSPYLNLG